ncbi:hypothetical protein [Nocardia sp. NPDC019255]|uniref:hypothetical protein n=1 Tax=Nocardia sp. NPDC019255 TaxID=3154591 RepID=UPI00340B5B6A
MKYQATAALVGKIWRVVVPGVGRVDVDSRARVKFEARILIADKLGVEPDSFEVEVSFVELPDPGEGKGVRVAREPNP